MESTIIGRLTANATTKTLNSGRTVVNFNMALNRTYKDKVTGETKQHTRFVECALWNRENIAQYLTKGRELILGGEFDCRAYNNAAGEAVKQLTFTVLDVRFAGSAKPADEPRESAAEPSPKKNRRKPATTAAADDLPF